MIFNQYPQEKGVEIWDHLCIENDDIFSIDIDISSIFFQLDIFFKISLVAKGDGSLKNLFPQREKLACSYIYCGEVRGSRGRYLWVNFPNTKDLNLHGKPPECFLIGPLSSPPILNFENPNMWSVQLLFCL